jgi:hypothetical protein
MSEGELIASAACEILPSYAYAVAKKWSGLQGYGTAKQIECDSLIQVLREGGVDGL